MARASLLVARRYCASAGLVPVLNVRLSGEGHVGNGRASASSGCGQQHGLALLELLARRTQHRDARGGCRLHVGPRQRQRLECRRDQRVQPHLNTCAMIAVTVRLRECCVRRGYNPLLVLAGPTRSQVVSAIFPAKRTEAVVRITWLRARLLLFVRGNFSRIEFVVSKPRRGVVSLVTPIQLDLVDTPIRADVHCLRTDDAF
mmetsp:Transcript_65546/g.195958  ORF Transcript_65546/g.195958 Transcript_65546/m.195958 type:complete len:202 (-) Transcript_65546:340-945(-)